jgi:hypothetical protein
VRGDGERRRGGEEERKETRPQYCKVEEQGTERMEVV